MRKDILPAVGRIPESKAKTRESRLVQTDGGQGSHKLDLRLIEQYAKALSATIQLLERKQSKIASIG
jgi:hypothetical protein